MWEELLRSGLEQMQKRGELSSIADPAELALALLAAVQGGLLLSQVRRDAKPLEIAVNTMINHLRTLAEPTAIGTLGEGVRELSQTVTQQSP